MPLDQLHEQERVEKEMSFFEHVDELRKHILRAGLYVIGLAILCFLFIDDIFRVVIYGPRESWFPTYQLLCNLGQKMGVGEKMCFKPPKFDIMTRQLGEVLTQQLMVAFWLGVIGAFPFIFWEFWKFIRPGLYEKEQKAVRGVVFVCSALFLLGVAFGYFIIAPFSISFLAGYTMEGTVVAPTLDSYITYMTMFTIPTGLIFEMPIVAFFLSKIGVLTRNFMRTYRRHAIVIILIVAAVITPPDVVSQMMVCIPLYILYEISIVVVSREQRRRERALQGNEARLPEAA